MQLPCSTALKSVLKGDVWWSIWVVRYACLHRVSGHFFCGRTDYQITNADFHPIFQLIYKL